LFLGRPFKPGPRRREKKSQAYIAGPYLDAALANFSGYLAIDEQYDGGYCILLAVDPRQQRRLFFEVLAHNPSQDDICRFLLRIKQELRRRRKTVAGITTDGSKLYPQPIALIFATALHQICRFHIIKELIESVRTILLAIRREWKNSLPALPPRQGRNKRKRQEVIQQRRQIEERIQELWDHRKLFVKRRLTQKEKQILKGVMAKDQRLKALRLLMNQVYRLFDRRCSTQTALGKVKKLRKRLKRYKCLKVVLAKLNSPNLEKALTFLDDELLESTSNSAERGNRRYRKMQEAVYGRRTLESITLRLALDFQREEQLALRDDILRLLTEGRV
jgi:hypothetical protein